MSEIPRHILPPWMGGDPQPPDEVWEEGEREVTPEEHEKLLREINAPRGALRAVSFRELGHLAKLPPVRDSEAVWELRRLLAEEPPGAPFTDGIAAALDFAFGQTLAGPVSGEPAKHTPPTCGDLHQEEMVALRVIRRETAGLDRPVPRHPDFVVGVEHTLMYLQCRTDDPPLGPHR